jgi:chromosomal replication initiation ATPase DnaA
MLLLIILPGNLLQLKQLWIRHQMQEQLEQANNITITHLQPGNIEWIHKGKEMRINGAMFDVEKYTLETDGTITVHGLFDSAEDKLAMEVAQTQNSNGSNTRKIFEQYLSKILQLPQQQYRFENFVINTLNSFPQVRHQNITECNRETIKPPPKASLI